MADRPAGTGTPDASPETERPRIDEIRLRRALRRIDRLIRDLHDERRTIEDLLEQRKTEVDALRRQVKRLERRLQPVRRLNWQRIAVTMATEPRYVADVLAGRGLIG